MENDYFSNVDGANSINLDPSIKPYMKDNYMVVTLVDGRKLGIHPEAQKQFRKDIDMKTLSIKGWAISAKGTILYKVSKKSPWE